MQTGNIMPKDASQKTAPRTTDLLAAMRKRIATSRLADAARIAARGIEYLPADLDQGRWNRSIDILRPSHS